MHIPSFADITDADLQTIRALIQDGQRMLAMSELRRHTGCPISWAKLWVQHEGRPAAISLCPYCGKSLKTALAKQCLNCSVDWHDPENPKKLVL